MHTYDSTGRCLYTDPDLQPFKVGKKVVGSDKAPQGSRVKKGVQYTITKCFYAYCKGKYYWYIGLCIQGANDGWLWPGLGDAVDEQFISITLSEVLEYETKFVGAN